MAALPDLTKDPTLEAVDTAIERVQSKRPRDYLGMSGLGSECERALWYSFRWCSEIASRADLIKCRIDGYQGESLQADRLRLVKGIELHTEDPETGEQFEFIDFGGHLRGHMDGAILGLMQAAKTWHVWEHKQVNEKKQRALQKAKSEKGEKAALEAWDLTYFGQAQLYMHFSGMTRHYLTCSSPGSRHTIGVRTDYQPTVALRLLVRAEYIITAESPPAKISDNPDHFVCQWCDHRDTCQGGVIPQVSCRTCVHSTPELIGDRRWSCARYRADLSFQEQETACEDHLFIPPLMPWPYIDASPEENWITYDTPAGILKNGRGGLESYQLREEQNASVVG